MNIELLDAKNGQKTIKVDSVYLHSSYNPGVEAERFAANLTIPFKPEKIVIIEPALSYCVPFLKNKYPECKLGFIKLCENLPERKGFDFELDFLNNQADFDIYLTKKFKEEEFFKTFFVTWPASSKVFFNLDSKIWKDIKDFGEKSKTLLITREYFEKKWLFNSVKFLKNTKKTIRISRKIDLPVLICASGPSLNPVLKIIQSNQDDFFIIALSSSVSVLIKNKIKPDLVFSTDGGYWAGQHLKKCKNMNLAIPAEAFCPLKILSSNNVLPLCYSDGFSLDFPVYCSENFYLCERNGTVSGSALDFALNITDEKIFFCGLDLSNQKGFQHTQPNELEMNNCIKENRIKNKETRLYPGSLKNDSLQIYENWFKNKKLPENKVIRIIDNKYCKNKLGFINDISTEEFKNLCGRLEEKSDKKSFFTINESKSALINEKNMENFKNELHSKIKNENFQKQLLPLSFLLLSHLEKNSEKYLLQQNKINKEINKITQKLDKIINE